MMHHLMKGMTTLSKDLKNNNKKIIGSIIKFNRINQKMSQKDLCRGICVPSYLSRIENGDLIPSEDVFSFLLERLGLTFNDSKAFVDEGQSNFNHFLDNLNFNEFDSTKTLFEEIESRETDYMTSPLIIDYFIVKLARYCSTPERDKFEDAKYTLHSAFDLLTPRQQSQYYFYVGVDILNMSSKKSPGKEYLKKALNYRDYGHCYFWLSYAYRIENNPIKAYDSIIKALDLYVAEGNILSIMDSYTIIAEVYFMLDNYEDAIHYLKLALRMAKKLNNRHYIEPTNSLIAWSYYRLGDYTSALDYLKRNTNIIDHRMLIPDSIVECLIYFALDDKEALKPAIKSLVNAASLEHVSTELANTLMELFTFYLENEEFMKTQRWEELLLSITHKIHKLVELNKVFTFFLQNYYINNRRYKEALLL